MAAIAVVWWLGVTTKDAEVAWTSMLHSKPAEIFLSVGGSVLGVLAIYWWFLRKVHRYLHGDAFFYALTGLPRK